MAREMENGGNNTNLIALAMDMENGGNNTGLVAMETEMENGGNNTDLIADASCDRKKLAGALLSSGVTKSSGALGLIIFQAPGGIFLHHGQAPFYLYYAILFGIVLFGAVEASIGAWVSSKTEEDRHAHAIGKTMLLVSILPLVFVTALGGYLVLRK